MRSIVWVKETGEPAVKKWPSALWPTDMHTLLTETCVFNKRHIAEMATQLPKNSDSKDIHKLSTPPQTWTHTKWFYDDKHAKTDTTRVLHLYRWLDTTHLVNSLVNFLVKFPF